MKIQLKKIIKKYGNTLIINFNNEDKKIYNINENDIITINDMEIEKPKREELKNDRRTK